MLKNSVSFTQKKIKIVHLQTTLVTESEKKSKEFIKKFEDYGIKYVNHKNDLYDGDEYLKNCLYPDLLTSDSSDRLTSRHYGCFDSHKKAIMQEFDDDIDFLIVCEGDCLFEISHSEFIILLNKITTTCKENNIGYFSFGDTKTLDYGVPQSNIKYVPNNQVDCFITDKIIGTQCIMYNKTIKDSLKKSFSNNRPWYVIDGWLNQFCWDENIDMAILFNRVTSQYSGESFVNKTKRNFLN